MWSGGNFPPRRSPPPLLQQATGGFDGPAWNDLLQYYIGVGKPIDSGIAMGEGGGVDEMFLTDDI